MFEDFIKIISLTLPVLIPGLALIFVLKLKLLKFLDIPLDFNMSINGKRIFGKNKTFKGVVVIAATAVSVAYILSMFFSNGYDNFIDPIFSGQPIFIGVIYSFSYILGELINSFVKRQINIPSGRKAYSKYKNMQIFFDLSDGIIAVFIALLLFTSASVYFLIAAGIIGLLLHFFTDKLMKNIGLKD